jgi:NitT/TauT family transport system substrate-binding protein
VKLQLQWFVQAQFGGYFAAKDQGIYDDYCLDVEILEGRRRHRAPAAARRRCGRLRDRLGAQSTGRPARPAPTSPTSPRSSSAPAPCRCRSSDAGITSPDDFAGKKIGNWGFGNEYEIFAALTEAGLDPATDVELVQQQFDMLGLLAGDIDAAEAMTYNEYAQVLEAVNPDTGELYTTGGLQRDLVRGRRCRHAPGCDLGRPRPSSSRTTRTARPR